MKHILLLLAIFMAGCTEPKTGFSSITEEAAIREVLARQEVAWNEGNVEDFMEGYWRSDSLKFIGSRITQGWDSTLARYKKGYPDLATMGKLRFELYSFQFIGTEACLVTGKYHLQRLSDEPSGMFTLLFRKIKGEWVIVYDHTS